MKKTAGIALVCIETCRVLFLEKAVGKSEGTWGFPGGTMDDGETFEEAIQMYILVKRYLSFILVR